MHASSTTVFLTLRSRLNILFIRRFAVVCLSWSKTSYPESALHLLPQRLNDEPPPTKTAIAPHKSYSGDERIAYVEPVSWRIAEAVSALSIIAIVATVAVPRISR